MKKEKILGNILFWCTLFSPLASFSFASMIGEINIFSVFGVIRYSWIMWLFIPIGVLSLLIGLKLKKGEQKYKKNFIIAFICIPLIIIFGSYRFIFKEISYDVSKISAIENEINLDLPNQVKIVTNEMGTFNTSYAKIIDNESEVEFENKLKTNSRWKDKLSSKIKSLLPTYTQYEVELFDYFLFYNVTRSEYNIYPPNGEYKIVFIAYDSTLNRLLIIDNYKIDLN